MNARTAARFRKWFMKHAPQDLVFDDPVLFLEELFKIDSGSGPPRCKNIAPDYAPCQRPNCCPPFWSDTQQFMWELSTEFEISHISPHELGPVLVDAMAMLALSS